jgi:hypothetical protein
MRVRERFHLDWPKPRRVDDLRLTALKARLLDLLQEELRP